MEPTQKSTCLFYTLLCLLLWSACVEALKGNCTDEHKKESLEKCATDHLKELNANHFFDGELELDVETEIFYKDPYRFVENSKLCEDSEEASKYVECSIKVFADCIETNSSDAQAHTSPSQAGKAVKKFCKSLNMIVEKMNKTSELVECVKEKKPDTYRCAYNKVMNENESAQDACTQYKIYSECMMEMDECGEKYEKDVALFSTWAKQMTPTQCLDTGAASSVIATVWVMLATLLVSLVARW